MQTGIIATSLMQKRTLKLDLYRDPGAVASEDEKLGIQRVGVVFSSSLAASSRDGPTEA